MLSSEPSSESSKPRLRIQTAQCDNSTFVNVFFAWLKVFGMDSLVSDSHFNTVIQNTSNTMRHGTFWTAPELECTCSRTASWSCFFDRKRPYGPTPSWRNNGFRRFVLFYREFDQSQRKSGSASKSRNPCRFNSCSSRLEPLVSKNMRFFRNAGLIRLVIRRSFCSSGEGSGQESSSDILLSPSPKWPLKLARLQGKGRGLVVQKKVKKGEVLLIEEPFSFVFSERKSLYFFVVMLCRQEFLTPRNTVHLKPD